MRLVIWIGLLIFFITSFFLFYIFDTIIKTSLSCILETESACNFNEVGPRFTFALILITFFVIIDIAAFYIMKITTDEEPFVL